MARHLECGVAAWVVVLCALVEAEQDAAVDGLTGTAALPSTSELATRGVRLAYGHAALHVSYVGRVLDVLSDRGFVEGVAHKRGAQPVNLWRLTQKGRAHLRNVVDDVFASVVRLVPPSQPVPRRRRR